MSPFSPLERLSKSRAECRVEAPPISRDWRVRTYDSSGSTVVTRSFWPKQHRRPTEPFRLSFRRKQRHPRLHDNHWRNPWSRFGITRHPIYGRLYFKQTMAKTPIYHMQTGEKYKHAHRDGASFSAGSFPKSTYTGSDLNSIREAIKGALVGPVAKSESDWSKSTRLLGVFTIYSFLSRIFASKWEYSSSYSFYRLEKS